LAASFVCESPRATRSRRKFLASDFLRSILRVRPAVGPLPASAWGRKWWNRNTRIAEERLLCVRLVSIIETSADIVTPRSAAISRSPSANASSRLMAVLRPETTTDLLSRCGFCMRAITPASCPWTSRTGGRRNCTKFGAQATYSTMPDLRNASDRFEGDVERRPERWMSAMGQKLTLPPHFQMSALPRKWSAPLGPDKLRLVS
jgi:hypothetical protein